MLGAPGHLGLSLGTESIWLPELCSQRERSRERRREKGGGRQRRQREGGGERGREAGRLARGGNSPPIAAGAPARGRRAAWHLPQHQDAALLLPDGGHLTILLSWGRGRRDNTGEEVRKGARESGLGWSWLGTVISLKTRNKLGGGPRSSLLDRVQAPALQTQEGNRKTPKYFQARGPLNRRELLRPQVGDQ